VSYQSPFDLNIGTLVVLSKFIPSRHDINDKVISIADLKIMNNDGIAFSYSYNLNTM
jgi:hypothetical protein